MYTVDNVGKLAPDIFMEVSKKISPQALKVCLLKLFLHFSLILPKWTVHKVILYNFMGLERDMLWLLE